MRAAIYFLPEPTSPLWSKASRLIGYDAMKGEACETVALKGLSTGSVAELTEEPRRYGFHATLKAPFHLSPECTIDELVTAAKSFGANGRSAGALELHLGLLKNFVALTPAHPNAWLDALAGECVAYFETFRAPMSLKDRTRRMEAALTEAQIALMDRWGYPYVFEEFQFHMTLTNVLPPNMQQPVLAALRDYLSPEDLVVNVDAISVCLQKSPTDRFREYARIALRNG